MKDSINVYNTRFDENRLISLVKESSHNCGYSEGTILDSPKKVADVLELVFDASNLPEERFWLFALDGARRIAGVFEVSHGTLMSSLVHPREVFTRAILCGSASIIVAHNHPSGSMDVSDQDREVTNRLRKAGELLGICLDDHIVIGGGEYTSVA